LPNGIQRITVPKKYRRHLHGVNRNCQLLVCFV
jgi:hypothetical protein